MAIRHNQQVSFYRRNLAHIQKTPPSLHHIRHQTSKDFAGLGAINRSELLPLWARN
jgi:hypothetical protein